MTQPGQQPRLLVLGAPEYCETIVYLLRNEEIVIHTSSLHGDLGKVFQKARPGVVVIDCVTPTLKGLSFFRWLRVASGHAPTPCLLIVAAGTDHRPRPEESTAPIEYLVAPIRQTGLRESLRRLFRADRAAPAAPRAGPPAEEGPRWPLDSHPPPAPPPAHPPVLADPPTAVESPFRGSDLAAIPEPDSGMLGRKILIVEDDQAHAQVLQEFLERGGFEVVQSSNLRAFENVLVQKPHLIVLDIRMPVLDGLTLAEVLKSCRLTMHIPIVFLTALTESRYAEASRNVRASAFVTKPVGGAQFLTTIHTVLEMNAE